MAIPVLTTSGPIAVDAPVGRPPAVAHRGPPHGARPRLRRLRRGRPLGAARQRCADLAVLPRQRGHRSAAGGGAGHRAGRRCRADDARGAGPGRRSWSGLPRVGPVSSAPMAARSIARRSSRYSRSALLLVVAVGHRLPGRHATSGPGASPRSTRSRPRSRSTSSPGPPTRPRMPRRTMVVARGGLSRASTVSPRRRRSS